MSNAFVLLIEIKVQNRKKWVVFVLQRQHNEERYWMKSFEYIKEQAINK